MDFFADTKRIVVTCIATIYNHIIVMVTINFILNFTAAAATSINML